LNLPRARVFRVWRSICDYSDSSAADFHWPAPPLPRFLNRLLTRIQLTRACTTEIGRQLYRVFLQSEKCLVVRLENPKAFYLQEQPSGKSGVGYLVCHVIDALRRSIVWQSRWVILCDICPGFTFRVLRALSYPVAGIMSQGIRIAQRMAECRWSQGPSTLCCAYQYNGWKAPAGALERGRFAWIHTGRSDDPLAAQTIGHTKRRRSP